MITGLGVPFFPQPNIELLANEDNLAESADLLSSGRVVKEQKPGAGDNHVDGGVGGIKGDVFAGEVFSKRLQGDYSKVALVHNLDGNLDTFPGWLEDVDADAAWSLPGVGEDSSDVVEFVGQEVKAHYSGDGAKQCLISDDW
jgi:hypothetical protein